MRASSLGCLSACGLGENTRIENNKVIIIPPEYEGYSSWITIIAIILAIVAFIFLIGIVFIYVESLCYPMMNPNLLLRSLSSDRKCLVSSQESLISLPSTNSDSDKSELLHKSSNSTQPISILSISIENEKLIDKILTTKDINKAEKKHVRFEGI